MFLFFQRNRTKRCHEAGLHAELAPGAAGQGGRGQFVGRVPRVAPRSGVAKLVWLERSYSDGARFYMAPGIPWYNDMVYHGYHGIPIVRESFFQVHWATKSSNVTALDAMTRGNRGLLSTVGSPGSPFAQSPRLTSPRYWRLFLLKSDGLCLT